MTVPIRMAGYGPPDTAFSRSLRFIGDQLESEFGADVSIEYVWNIMDLGHRGEEIIPLVEDGTFTLGYQSSSYFTDRVPELGVVDLPFLFDDTTRARAAMDGRLGDLLASSIEERTSLRVVGFFENGFRHLSNRLRPVRSPADLAGMTIRVMPSDVHARTFALLGATPVRMDLSEAITAIAGETVDAQENPLANTVTYGVHRVHRFHTLTGHFYVSRPIFAHRPTIDAWPKALRHALYRAVREAVVFQRGLSEREAVVAHGEIVAAGGVFVDLEREQRDLFRARVQPMLDAARHEFSPELVAATPLQSDRSE